MNCERGDYVSNVYENSINTRHVSLDISNMASLLWDLIGRVINTMIGVRVKNTGMKK